MTRLPRRRRTLVRWLILNLDNNRDPAQIRAELGGAIAMGVDLILAVETIGSGAMPDLPGYTTISDRSTDGRKNVTAWVRDGVTITGITWTDHRKSFPRKPGKPGSIPARATLMFWYGRVPVLVGHIPPGWRGTTAARFEAVSITRRGLTPWLREGWEKRPARVRARARLRPVAAGMDVNGTGGLIAAGRARLRRCGDGPELFLYRNMRVVTVKQLRVLGGVRFEGDHGDTLYVETLIADRWLKPRTRL